jgi:hypothetical protein
MEAGMRRYCCLLLAVVAILVGRPSSAQFIFRFDAGQGVPVESIVTPEDAADLDGDGNLDVAYAETLRGTVHVALGNGEGDLVEAFEVGAVASPTAMAVLDADEDGLADLVVASGEDLVLTTFLNLGGGIFAEGATIPLLFPAAGIAVSDVDGDGRCDLALRYSGVSSVSFYRGDGRGGFRRPKHYQIGHEVLDLVLGDFDGDGSEDLAVAVDGRFDGLAVMVFVRMQNQLVFSWDSLRTSIYGVESIAVGDTDADGDLDLVAAGGYSGIRYEYLWRLRGRNDGTFTLGSTCFTGRHPHPTTVLAANLRGIPRRDFALYSNNGLKVALDGGCSLSGIGGARPLLAGDFDADGAEDLVCLLDGTTLAVELSRSARLYTVLEGTTLDDTGDPADVVFVNGSPGEGYGRRVDVGPTDPLTLNVDTPPGATGMRRFALYGWKGFPRLDTIEDLPHDAGAIAFPTPITGLAPQPLVIWNNLGFFPRLGVPGYGSSPAPADLVTLPGGLGREATFTLQGLMEGEAGADPEVTVTNGVVVRVREGG